MLPPTDTRFRTDQRALEIGDMKLATSEKHRLEEKQRAARKIRESEKLEYKCQYFDQYVDEFMPGAFAYKVNLKYWEDRKTGNWSHLADLFSERE
jgi:hypothetical protein